MRSTDPAFSAAGEMFDQSIAPAAEALRARGQAAVETWQSSPGATTSWAPHDGTPLLRQADDRASGQVLAGMWREAGLSELQRLAVAIDTLRGALPVAIAETGEDVSPYIYAMF